MPETRTCPECGGVVASGRLSCPACGALLATVRGRSAQQPIAIAGPAASPAGSPAPDPAAAGIDEPRDPPPAPARPPVEPALVGEQGPSATPSGTRPAAPARAAPAWAAGGSRPPATDLVSQVPALPRPSAPATLPGGSGPSTPPWGVATPPQATASPGAAAPRPSGPPASASPDRPRDGGQPRPSAVDLPFNLPPGLGPRLVVGGAMVGVLAFFLPWAGGPGGVVIGGGLGLSYFAQWGLASPGNLLPLAATVLVLALGLMPGRVPAWLAYGVLPVVDGGVLFGIAWTYLASKYALGIGIDVLAVAAVVLVTGGTIVLRHAADGPTVT